MKYIPFLIVLLLAGSALADDVIIPPDPVHETTSFNALISKIDSQKADIAGVNKNIQELKVQFDKRVDKLHFNLLLSVVFVSGALFCLLRFFDRVLSWLVWKKTKREYRNYYNRILEAVKESGDFVESVDLSLLKIHTALIGVDTEFKALDDRIQGIEDKISVVSGTAQEKPNRLASNSKLYHFLVIFYGVLCVFVGVLIGLLGGGL